MGISRKLDQSWDCHVPTPHFLTQQAFLGWWPFLIIHLPPDGLSSQPFALWRHPTIPCCILSLLWPLLVPVLHACLVLAYVVSLFSWLYLLLSLSLPAPLSPLFADRYFWTVLLNYASRSPLWVIEQCSFSLCYELCFFSLWKSCAFSSWIM